MQPCYFRTHRHVHVYDKSCRPTKTKFTSSLCYTHIVLKWPKGNHFTPLAQGKLGLVKNVNTFTSFLRTFSCKN